LKLQAGPWKEWPVAQEESAVTIGVLDGVHIGHRRLIRHLHAGGGTSTVLTFEPHPAEVLSPGTNPRLVTTLEERVALFESAGIARLGVFDLAEIRYLAPEEFVSDVLVGVLRMRRLVAGPDFRFGRDRSGDIALLDSLAGQFGFEVEVVDLVESDGVVSSSRIRGLIEAGEVAEASRHLGSFYRMSNVVVNGDRRGKAIGFPTANLVPPARKVIPADGVYAALATADGGVHKAAVNVGVRPTFGEGDRVVEAYLLDFEGDLYGKSLTLEFVSRIREEVRFDSVEELVARMRGDVDRARAALEGAIRM
jgi:riboflavin kinase / FMN adenylyltransferase